MIRQKSDVEALAESIERFANEALIATWCVIELFPLLKPYHWAAYAKDAHIPHPSPETIEAAIRLFKTRIGYRGPGLPLEPSRDPVDTEGATLLAIESRRSF